MQVLFALFIIASSFAASAQVRELWRFDIVGNSNPSINYVAKAAAIDRVGNTIVAGDRIDEFWNQKVFVRKINPAGQMLWEYVVPHAGSGSLQNRLSLEKNGNITLAVRLFGAPYAILVIKISPDSQELWEYTSTAFFLNSPDPTTDVVTDQSGNTFFAAPFGAGPSAKMSITKLDSRGTVKWRRMLPGTGLGINHVGPFEPLLPLPDGSLIVAGSYQKGYLAKFRPDGYLTWYSPYLNPWLSAPLYGKAVLVGAQIWATDFRTYTIYNHMGRALRFGALYGNPVVSNDQKIILAAPSSFDSLSYLAAWNASGRFLWLKQTGLGTRLGLIEDNSHGWIACSNGPYGYDGLQFARFDRQGNKTWSSVFPDYFRRIQPKEVFLGKAPDGSLRLVANSNLGLNIITVAAFEIPN